MKDTDTASALTPKTERSPYVKPSLNTFGLLADITRKVGTTGLLADKAGGGTNKTM